MKAKYLDVRKFVRDFNKLRQQNQNTWIVFVGDIGNKKVAIKSYNSWVQRIRINGKVDGAGHGMNVTEWRTYITKALSDNQPPSNKS